MCIKRQDGRVGRWLLSLGASPTRDASGVITVSKGRWTGLLYPHGEIDDPTAAVIQRMLEARGQKRIDLAVDGLAKEEEAEAEKKDMLFDVDSDPKQERDVASEHPELLAELRADLISLLQETDTTANLIEPWV